MAQTKIKYRQVEGGLDGWIPAEQTWAYASATTITVPSGAASKYQKGDKIKLTQTTVKYFYIVGVADTVLTVTGGSDYTVANAAITSPYFSKMENPQGFPLAFAFTPTLTAETGTITTASVNGAFSLHGGLCYVRYVVSVTNNGSGATANRLTLPINGLGDTTATFAGREYLATGKMVQGMLTSATQIRVLDYANSYILGNNYALSLSGCYTIG